MHADRIYGGPGKLHLNGFRIAINVITIERFGIKRAKSASHKRIQMGWLDPCSGRIQDKVALVETVVKVEGDWSWLYTALNLDINQILHGVYSTMNTSFTKEFF